MEVKNWDEIPLVMSMHEVREVLRVSKPTLYKWVSEGKLPVKRIGKRRFAISREALKAFLEQ